MIEENFRRIKNDKSLSDQQKSRTPLFWYFFKSQISSVWVTLTKPHQKQTETLYCGVYYLCNSIPSIFVFYLHQKYQNHDITQTPSLFDGSVNDTCTCGAATLVLVFSKIWRFKFDHISFMCSSILLQSSPNLSNLIKGWIFFYYWINKCYRWHCLQK